MKPPISSNRRIAKNTSLLYLRTLIGTLAALFSTQIVLRELGVDGYGTVSVVAGFVGLLSFLPASLAAATQRFFAHEIGRRDEERLQQMFCVNALLYALIAVGSVLLLETVGINLFREYIRLPPARLTSAVYVFHISVAMFVISMAAAPLIAVIIAHEDMHYFARFSVGEAILKAGAALALPWIQADKMVTYAGLLLVCALVNLVLYYWVCTVAYPACRFSPSAWNPVMARNVTQFAGWSLFGQLTTLGRTQANTILINQYFSPATVAASAIAMSISNHAATLSQGLNASLYGPIVKAEAAKEDRRVAGFILTGMKLSFCLMWVVALPLLCETEVLLRAWLGSPPPEAAVFVRITLTDAVIVAMSQPLIAAIRARGRLAAYETTVSVCQLFLLGASWITLMLGGPALSVFAVAVVGSVLLLSGRIAFLMSSRTFTLRQFTAGVGLPGLRILAGSISLAVGIQYGVRTFGINELLATVGIGVSTLCCVYYLGLERGQRESLVGAALSRLPSLREGLTKP